MSFTNIAIFVASTLLVIMAFSFSRRPLPSGNERRLPPKINNLRVPAVSANQPWKVYHTLSKSLGSTILTLADVTALPFPISFIQCFFQSSPLIVLNDALSTVELFHKRSEIFSDRPYWPMRDLLGRDENVGFMPYGSKLTKARKLLHSEFHSSQLHQWDLLVKEGISILVKDLALADLHKYSNPRDALRRNLEQIMFRLTYGADITPQFLALLTKVNEQTGSALQPGRWAVNSLPFLAYIPPWFPFANFQRWAQNTRDIFCRLVEEPFKQVKREIALEKAKPSFVHNRLIASGSHGAQNSEKLIMTTAGSIFSAGVDTTVSLLETIFLMLSRDPALQERIYRELTESGFDLQHNDIVADGKLSLINSVLKEGLRFNPPTPLLLHSPSKDTTYQGWFIPRGSWVFANVWSIMHDADVFNDPEKFNPERFLYPQSTDPVTFAFGLGRRRCPGEFLARRVVHSVLTQTVLLYKIMPLGNLSTPIMFSTGLISYPKDFDLVFVPRDTEKILDTASSKGKYDTYPSGL